MENLLPLKERLQIIKDQVDYSVERPIYKTGGQNCGIISNTIVAKHEDLGIEIKIKIGCCKNLLQFFLEMLQ